MGKAGEMSEKSPHKAPAIPLSRLLTPHSPPAQVAVPSAFSAQASLTLVSCPGGFGHSAALQGLVLNTPDQLQTMETSSLIYLLPILHPC